MLCDCFVVAAFPLDMKNSLPAFTELVTLAVYLYFRIRIFFFNIFV